MKIPLINMAGFTSDDLHQKDQVVTQWRDALDRIGFVLITGHGIPESLLSSIQQGGRKFFELPVDTKRRYMASGANRGSLVGYVPLKGESVGSADGARAAPDLCESLTIDQPALLHMSSDVTVPERQLHSGEFVQFRKLIGDYADHAYAIGRMLMRISALALGLAEDYFSAFYSPMTHRLRFAYYPEQQQEPEPGQLRNAAHTDFAGFTILLQDDAPGGLQVLSPDGVWIDVPAIPGTLVINTGDLIQRWTNDRWTSNVHRVVNPPRDGKSSRRLSVVFFTGPVSDSEIACLPGCCPIGEAPRYDPIRAGDHVQAKIALTRVAN